MHITEDPFQDLFTFQECSWVFYMDGVKELEVKELPVDIESKSRVIRLPFPGLYDSCIKYSIDNDFESHVDYARTDAREGDYTIFEEAKEGYEKWLGTLSEEEKQSIISRSKTLSVTFNVDLKNIVANWIKTIQGILEDYLKRKLKFDLMLEQFHSPKEYNFYSDTLDVIIHEEDWKELCTKDNIFQDPEYVKAAEYDTTSHSGYIPFYKFEDAQDIDMPVSLTELVIRKVLQLSIRDNISDYWWFDFEEDKVDLNSIEDDIWNENQYTAGVEFSYSIDEYSFFLCNYSYMPEVKLVDQK